MESTLADKVLKKTPLDLQKRFPIFHVCPNAWRPFSAARHSHLHAFSNLYGGISMSKGCHALLSLWQRFCTRVHVCAHGCTTAHACEPICLKQMFDDLHRASQQRVVRTLRCTRNLLDKHGTCPSSWLHLFVPQLRHGLHLFSLMLSKDMVSCNCWGFEQLWQGLLGIRSATHAEKIFPSA